MNTWATFDITNILLSEHEENLVEEEHSTSWNIFGVHIVWISEYMVNIS